MIGDKMRLTRNSKRDIGINRLCDAMRHARTQLKVFRDNRKRLIRMYVGADYSDNATVLRRPLNMISMWVNLVRRAIVNRSPRAMLTTWDESHPREVWTAQAWGNRQFERMGLGFALDRWVTDSLFCLGIMKTGIVKPTDSEVKGWKLFAGEAYADTVDFDDYVLDVFARNFNELGYEGHRYRAPADSVNRLYKLRGSDKVEASPQSFNLDGDERAAMIARGYLAGDVDEYVELTDLWEIYVPAHRAILTFRADGGGTPNGEDDLIEAREYIGPYCGPYIKLSMNPVPGNLMPKSPLMDMVALDDAINKNLRKLIRQCNRVKEITEYTSASSDDMKRINAASDGDSVMVSKPGEINQRVYGNPNAQLFGITMQFKQLFSWLGGNMDAFGGLARQAGTAAQEAQINQNAGATIASMQEQTLNQTREVMNNLFWYFWNDPEGVMRANYKPIESRGDIMFPRTLTPQERQQIPWEDLEVKVDPYSMTGDTPAQRLQFLNGLVNMIMPMLPVIGQQGVQFDARAWLRKVAEYANQPDVRDIFSLGDPLPGQSPMAEEAPGKPPVTNRTYTRKSESEATPQGQESDMISQLMGSGATGAGDYQGGE